MFRCLSSLDGKLAQCEINIMKTVSIIIPIYNVSQYVKRCINSVMSQTYKDIECILVNDCTPDNSIDLCEQLISDYTGPIQFKILHHKQNRGLSAARNTGTEAATGEYIYYLDSDDEITHDCIQTLMDEAIANPSTEIVCADCIEPYDGPRRCFHIKERTHLTNNNDIRFLLFCQEQSIPVMAWNKLVRTSFLRENNISFEEGLLHEDVLWIYEVVLRIKNLILLSNKTYIYHLNNQSIVHSFSERKRAESMAKIITTIASKLSPPLLEIALYKYILRILAIHKYVPYHSYRKASKTFCKLLWKIGDRRSAVALRYFLRWGKTLSLNKVESLLYTRIREHYKYYNRIISISFNQSTDEHHSIH